MEEGHVSCNIDEKGLATIEFGHPSSNALPGKILSKLANAITEISNDPSCKLILLKSAGNRAFCAGASFDELSAIKNIEDGKVFFSGFANVINACRTSSKLIIGRIHGKAVGGGVGIASAVDYAFATEAASVKTAARNAWKAALTKVRLGDSTFGNSGLEAAFKNCTILKEFITTKGVTNTSAVTTLKEMFSGCGALETIDMRGMDTSAVTSFEKFHNMSSGSKTINVIGLHSRNISSLASGNAVNGFANAFTNVQISNNELNKCYVAWGNNTFGTTPIGRFTNAPATGTGTVGVTAKVNYKTAQSNGSVAAGSNAILLRNFLNGETQTIADLQVGDRVESSNAAFPTGMVVLIGSIVGNTITLVRADNGDAVNLTGSGFTNNVLLRFPVTAGHTVIPVDTFTGPSGNVIGSISTGLTISHPDGDFPTNATVTAVGTRTITISSPIGYTTGSAHTTAGVGKLFNNTDFTFKSNVLTLAGAPTGTIRNGMTVTGTGITGTPKVADATNQSALVMDAPIAQPGANTLTFNFSSGDVIAADFGTATYKNSAEVPFLGSTTSNTSHFFTPSLARETLTTNYFTNSSSGILGKSWTISDGGIG